jgi:hypothetical protein
VRALSAHHPELEPYVTWTHSTPSAEATAEQSARPLEARYSIDLAALSTWHDLDTAFGFDDSLLLPTGTWLLRPTPLPRQLPVEVELYADALRMATALDSARPHTHTLLGHELRVGTYTAFGDLLQTTLHIGGAGPGNDEDDTALRSRPGTSLDVVFLEPDTWSDVRVLQRWIARAAEGVANFYGGFVPGTTLFVVPSDDPPGKLHGKLLPTGGLGVALTVSRHTELERLPEDWVLVHELFHLGTVSFFREGRWFDEGLATYFEPLIRARLDWYPEAEVWREFRRYMPLGAEALEGAGLERAEDFRGVYWGGALFCLLSDLTIRKHSAHRLGLEDALRTAFRRGAHAGKVRDLRETLRALDGALEELGAPPILVELAQRHAFSGHPVPADLWQLLGSVKHPARTPAALPSPDTPDENLSELRRSIVHGKP